MSNAETTYFMGNSTAVTQAHAARTAANSIKYLLPTLRKLYAENPSFKFLDVGCGPGSITLDLAHLFPTATFVGVDGSASVISQANAAAAAAGAPTNARFAVCDMLHLAAAGHTAYDVVLAHQVLLHVPDACAALASLHRAARPDGGIVSARTFDWDMIAWHPPSEGLALQRQLYIDVAHALGNDPHAGRKQHALAARAGWARHQIESGADADWCYNSPSRRALAARLMVGRYTDDGEFAKRLRETGVAGERGVEETLELIREGYQRWADDEDGWMVMTNPWLICYNGRAAPTSTRDA